jgi:hypothetical protein
MKKWLAIILISMPALAQETAPPPPQWGWKKEMVGSANLTQNSFDNWKQGGENSTAWQLNLNVMFTNDREKSTWKNTGKFTYGETKTSKMPSRTSIDEIKLESVYTYKFTKFVNPFIATTGETQFAPGYDYGASPRVQVSAFMDPGYVRESLGAGYKPNDHIQTRLGASLKQTFTRDYPKPYADDPKTTAIEKFKSEVGAESVTDLDIPITGNSVLKSKLELFTAFKSLDATDVNWDNLFSVKISKFADMNFNVKLFYDKDISKKRQLKQAMAIGLSYNFI